VEEVLFDITHAILDAPFGVRRELRLMRIKQNRFSPSRILFTLGAASALS
jgi:hypothetical protein